MLKEILYRTMSVLMACVVLLSTMSFTVDLHYCGDTLVDTAIFQKVKTWWPSNKKSKLKHTVHLLQSL